jgi:hypothetical protein
MFDKGLYISQWIVLSTILILLCISANSAEAESWQEEMLYHPSADQLALEKEGLVMIYDGLTSRQVSDVLDTQFDRIGSMMFVRTVVTDDKGEALHDDESGQLIVEDDGC